MNDFDFIRQLTRDDGFLYTKDVTDAGFRREQLKRMMAYGLLIQEARGIYSFTDEWTDEFVLLQIRCKKGIFSYGTALYFHGMSDRFPTSISMTIPKTYNAYYLQSELTNTEFHRVKPEWWNIGITEMPSPQGGTIRVYDKERCICDIIRNRKCTDPQIFIQALKEYFSSKNRNTLHLIEYATQFNIREKVQMYMEVLS